MAILVSTQVTGSLGITGQVAAPGFSGSLHGTASWSQNAISSSYTLSSSYSTQFGSSEAGVLATNLTRISNSYNGSTGFVPVVTTILASLPSTGIYEVKISIAGTGSAWDMGGNAVVIHTICTDWMGPFSASFPGTSFAEGDIAGYLGSGYNGTQIGIVQVPETSFWTTRFMQIFVFQGIAGTSVTYYITGSGGSVPAANSNMNWNIFSSIQKLI